MDNTKTEELQKIDLTVLFRNTLRCLRRLWVLVLALMLLGSGLMALRSTRNYTPMYKSEATFSVSVNYSGVTDILSYNYYYDNAAAQLVADTFPYILENELTRELIKSELGTAYINGGISASSVAGTNFFVLTVRSSSAEDAYNIIRAVIDVYPQVSRQVIGETQLVISREPQLAAEPYNSLSLKRPVVLGAAAGLVLGLLIALALGALRRTVRNADDVKRLVNLNCLASVPHVRAKRRSKNPRLGFITTRMQPDAPFAESFRLLRLKLLRALEGSDAKVIMFTSTVPSEGKSTVAANAAISLARDGKKVLLIDADLRGQSVKPLLGLTEPSVGLAACLENSAEKVKFIRFENTSLYVFAGDESVDNPMPLLRYNRLRGIFQTLRPLFDYIVLDTPPCGMMADASVLCRHADKVVYVIREDFASCGQISDSVQGLHANGADLCGFVLNCSRSGSHSSRYGYGYGYSRKYSYSYPESRPEKSGD